VPHGEVCINAAQFASEKAVIMCLPIHWSCTAYTDTLFQCIICQGIAIAIAIAIAIVIWLSAIRQLRTVACDMQSCYDLRYASQPSETRTLVSVRADCGYYLIPISQKGKITLSFLVSLSQLLGLTRAWTIIKEKRLSWDTIILTGRWN
jgi:hypothetical protein